MKLQLLLSLTILLFSCDQTNQQIKTEFITIEVGDYLFDFPSDFKVVNDKGIDSYVGQIQGDSIAFGFDFGYYSDDFQQTAQEYLEGKHWRMAAEYQLMKEGVPYDQTNTLKIDVLNIRQATEQDSLFCKDCDYIAKCKHDEKEFNFAIYLPLEIKQQGFIIDTVGNQFRKIIFPKNNRKGITGIYLRELNSFNESINSYLALSMATTTMTKAEQDLAIKIFKSGRPSNKEKR